MLIGSTPISITIAMVLPSSSASSCDASHRSLANRLASGGAWMLGSKGLHALFMLISNMMLARMLAPELLGRYFVAYSVVLVASFIGQLGLNTTAIRMIGASIGSNDLRGARDAFRTVSRLAIISSVVAGLLTTVVVSLISTYAGDTIAGGTIAGGTIAGHTVEMKLIAWKIGTWSAILALTTVVSDIFRGFQDFRFSSLFNGPGYHILFSAALLAWSFSHRVLTLDSALNLSIAAAGLHLLIAYSVLHRVTTALLGGSDKTLADAKISASTVSMTSVLILSLPLMFTWLAMRLQSQLDLWLVGSLCLPEEAALYGAVTRWTQLVAIPMTIVNALLPSFIAELYARGDVLGLERTLRSAASVSAIPAAFILLATIGFGSNILGWVYGPYFEAGAPVLIALSVGMLCSVLVGAPLETLMMSGHSKTAMVIGMAAVFVLIIVGYFLVAIMGPLGVAMAAAGTIAAREFAWMLAVRWRLGIWTFVYTSPGDWLTIVPNGFRPKAST